MAMTLTLKLILPLIQILFYQHRMDSLLLFFFALFEISDAILLMIYEINHI